MSSRGKGNKGLGKFDPEAAAEERKLVLALKRKMTTMYKPIKAVLVAKNGGRGKSGRRSLKVTQAKIARAEKAYKNLLKLEEKAYRTDQDNEMTPTTCPMSTSQWLWKRLKPYEKYRENTLGLEEVHID